MASKRKSSTACDAPAMPKAADERKWRAQSALETITRAADMQKDKGLMRDVKKLAAEQVKTLSSVAGRK